MKLHFYNYLYNYLYQSYLFFTSELILLSRVTYSLKDFIWYFFKMSLLEMNSVSLCLFWNVIIPPSFLEDSFAVYKILIWQVFPPSFSTLNILSLNLWHPLFSMSAISFIKIFLYVMSLFSIAAFKSFYLPVAFNIYSDAVCLCVDLNVFLLDSSSFLCMQCFSSNLGSFQHLPLRIFFSSFFSCSSLWQLLLHIF